MVKAGEPDARDSSSTAHLGAGQPTGAPAGGGRELGSGRQAAQSQKGLEGGGHI